MIFATKTSIWKILISWLVYKEIALVLRTVSSINVNQMIKALNFCVYLRIETFAYKTT